MIQIIYIINLNKYNFFNKSISIKFKKEAYIFLFNTTFFFKIKMLKRNKIY